MTDNGGPYICKYDGLIFDTKQGYCIHLSKAHGIDSRKERIRVLEQQGYVNSKRELKQRVEALEQQLQEVRA